MPKKGCSYGTRIVYKTGKSRCPSQKKYGPKTKRAFTLGANKAFKNLIAKRSKKSKKSSYNSSAYDAFRARKINMLKQEAANMQITGDAVWDYVYSKLEEQNFPETFEELSASEQEMGKKLTHTGNVML